MTNYMPGLRIYRRVGDEFFFHPVGDENEKTIVQLAEASSDGVRIKIASPSGETEDETMKNGDTITFGEKNLELTLVLDESMAGHASFRCLAGPEVFVRRVDRRMK